MNDDGGSPVTSIKIDFKNSSILNNWRSVEVSSTNENSYKIQNLARATVYDFKIRASNSKGESQYSEIVKIETKGEELSK